MPIIMLLLWEYKTYCENKEENFYGKKMMTIIMMMKNKNMEIHIILTMTKLT